MGLFNFIKQKLTETKKQSADFYDIKITEELVSVSHPRLDGITSKKAPPFEERLNPPPKPNLILDFLMFPACRQAGIFDFLTQ
jgi:hypothetical protein